VKLTVVAGWRELMLPIGIPLATLEGLLRTVEPTAVLPQAAWARGESTSPYHTFLDDVAVDSERRIELFLEYVEAATAPGAHPFVVLPYERLIPEGGPLDARLPRFVARAEARFGHGSVRLRRLEMSRGSSELLRRLAAEVGVATRPASPEVGSQLDVEALAGRGEAFDAMRSNFTHAILELGERRVAATSLFGMAPGRVGLIAEQLAATNMRLDADVPLERIVAELDKGGELWALLTRPVARPPAPIIVQVPVEPATPLKKPRAS
jgi:hypothetical protein